jgi:membrane protease YdiL (CAAX protease family)
MQLIYLAGIVCLVIAPHLRWWPAESSDIVAWYSPELGGATRAKWWYFLAIVLWLFHFASGGGYFSCFWPGRRPARRIRCLVLLPALTGLSVISGRFVYLYLPRSSVFVNTASRFSRSIDWTRVELWDLGPGFHICLLGIGLILIFVIQLSRNSTSLPLELALQGAPTPKDDDGWRRTQKLILYVVTPLVLLPSLVIGVSIAFYPFANSNSLSSGEMLYVHFIQDVILPFVTIGIATWISGSAGRKQIRRWLGWFNPVYLALAILIPFGLWALFSAGVYLYDYIYWGAHNYGHFAPPNFWTYFGVPRFSYAWIAFAALAEEIIFRAVIQSKLIQRYGISRGLLLTVFIWSAYQYHFFSSFNSRMTDLDVPIALGFRLFVCLSLGFVLGWLALRSGSIWPAVITHAVYNLLLLSGRTFQFRGDEIVRVSLWAVLAVLLFRHWPPQEVATVAAPPDLPSDLLEIGPA